MLLFIEMSCNRTSYIISLNRAPMLSDALFKGAGCLTYMYITNWTHSDIDNSICFTGNKVLNVNDLSIDRLVKRLEGFGILAVFTGSN